MKDFFEQLDPAKGLHKSDEGLFQQLVPAKVHHKGDEGHFPVTRLGKGLS